jgi:hypothetical protein
LRTFLSTLFGTLFGSVLVLVVFWWGEFYKRRANAIELYENIQNADKRVEKAYKFYQDNKNNQGIVQFEIYIAYDYIRILSRLNRKISKSDIQNIIKYHDILNLIELYRKRFFNETDKQKNITRKDYDKQLNVSRELFKNSEFQNTVRKLEQVAYSKPDVLKVFGIIFLGIIIVIALGVLPNTLNKFIRSALEYIINNLV